MKNIKAKAKKYFEEEMSGKPLTQESVIEGLIDFYRSTRNTKISNWIKTTFCDHINEQIGDKRLLRKELGLSISHKPINYEIYLYEYKCVKCGKNILKEIKYIR